MKKYIVLLLALTLSVLTACEAELEEESLSAIAPNGAPSLSQALIEFDPDHIEPLEYEVDVVAGPDMLVSAFGSESHDLIFAPTNQGANLYQSGTPYQLAAVVSFGNLYLASGQTIDDFDDLEGETITLFGQNSVPDIIVRTLLDSHDFDNPPTLDYVDSVDAAGGILQSDSENIVLLAEPALSVQQTQFDDTLSFIDLQDAWNNAFDKAGYPQAGLFVHEDVSDDALKTYLNGLKASIDLANDDPETMAAHAASLDYPFPEPVMQNAIPRSNLRFQTSTDATGDVEHFFEQILSLEAGLIGGSLPDEDFYRHVDLDD